MDNVSIEELAREAGGWEVSKLLEAFHRLYPEYATEENIILSIVEKL